MNEYYYDKIIKYYLHPSDRQVLTKNDYHLHAYKMAMHYRKRIVLANISLHCGTPCNRYCICQYFDISSILMYYNRVTDSSALQEPSD